MPDIVGRLKTPRLPSAPSSPTVGELYFNTATNILYWWNGTTWISASGGAGSDNLRYNGDWAAGSYLEGDVVVDGGVSYLAVRPTSARPAAWPGASLAASGIASTATGDVAATNVQAALAELAAEKQAKSEKGVANGYASLDSGAKVPLAQLPPISGGGVDYIGDWAAPTAYKKGDVVRYNGNDYMAVNDSTGVAPPATGTSFIPLTGASYGTSFPATPFNGQEHILVDSTTSPTYQWRFRYNSGSSSAYKWEFIGGPHWHMIDGAGYTITPINTWVGSASTDFIAPRSGDYEFTLTAQYGTPVVNTQCFIGVANASVSNNPSGGQWGIYVGNYDTITVIPVLTGIVAGQTLRPVFNSPIANMTVAFRTFRAVPRRVS